MKKQIAFIDLDGTLIQGDSMHLFLRFLVKSPTYYFYLFTLLPAFFSHKMGTISTERWKALFLNRFLQKYSEHQLSAQAKHFAKKVLTEHENSRLVNQALEWKNQGFEICVVTASCNLWTQPWCALHGFSLISTQLDISLLKAERKLASANCKGLQKVEEIKRIYLLENYETIHAIGDSPSDQPMISLRKNSTYSL